MKSLMIIQWSDKKIQGIRSDRVPEELWMEVPNIVQEMVTKTIPKKKKCKKAKWLSEEALQIADKRSERKRHILLKAKFQKIARRDKKALSEQCKEIEENSRTEKTRSLLRKSEIRRNISCKTGTIKDKNNKDLTEGINKRWQKYTE